MVSSIKFSTFIKIFFLIAWVALFGMLLQRDYFVKALDIKEEQVLKRGREESFLGIYFRDERIGYVKHKLIPLESGDFKLFQNAYLLLNIVNQQHPVRMNIEAEITGGSQLKKFTFNLTSPFYKMDAQGKVNNNIIRFSLYTGKERINDVIRLKDPPLLSTNRRAYLLKQGLQKGEKIKVPYFDPISLSGKDTVLEYRGIEKILVQDRIYNLHHFIETFSGMRINSWLDDEGKVIKEESPAGFVFISQPEFKATDIKSPGQEILSSVSVPLIGNLPDLTNRKILQYKLTMPEEGYFDIDKDRQSLSGDLLTLTLETLPDGNAVACTGHEKELASTPYIQSQNNRITGLAQSLIKDAGSDLEKVETIAGWVFANLEKRPVLGIPDALTTLHTKMGDCNEHAALFAGLARSVSIPTRVVAGVTFHQGAFFYHAWNEVCLDNKWLSLDTTKDQFPADITHIKFVEGETREMIRIGALLGKLQIETMP